MREAYRVQRARTAAIIISSISSSSSVSASRRRRRRRTHGVEEAGEGLRRRRAAAHKIIRVKSGAQTKKDSDSGVSPQSDVATTTLKGERRSGTPAVTWSEGNQHPRSGQKEFFKSSVALTFGLSQTGNRHSF